MPSNVIPDGGVVYFTWRIQRKSRATEIGEAAGATRRVISEPKVNRPVGVVHASLMTLPLTEWAGLGNPVGLPVFRTTVPPSTTSHVRLPMRDCWTAASDSFVLRVESGPRVLSLWFASTVPYSP